MGQVESAFHEGATTASGAAAMWVLVHFLAATHPRMGVDRLGKLIGNRGSPIVQEIIRTFLDEIERNRKRKGKRGRRIEGGLEGARRAREQMLLDHLQAHFDPIPGDTKARIAAVTDAKLMEFQLRVLTEPTLERVLQDVPPAPPVKKPRSPAPTPRTKAPAARRAART